PEWPAACPGPPDVGGHLRDLHPCLPREPAVRCDRAQGALLAPWLAGIPARRRSVALMSQAEVVHTEPVAAERNVLLDVQHLSKTYGKGERAVHAIGDVTFQVYGGEFACIIGPSGCGKTMLLKCLSGLLKPTSGGARLDGELITAPPRRLALVFQDYSRSLLPWMSVRKNVSLPLQARGVPRA